MSDVNPKKTDAQYNPRESAQRWEKELQAAQRELKKFHLSAKKINKKYLDQREGGANDGAFKLNLFWSNVQVLKAALYAKPPRVDVSNSFKDSEDDVSRVAANILERMLNHSVEKDASDFDVSAHQAVGDYLIVGLGAIWYRYEVETNKQMTEPVMAPDGVTQLVAPEEYEAIVSENCLTEYVYWEDFWWSPARTWEEVRWVARRVFMNKEQLTKRFGEKIAKEVPLTKQKRDADSMRPQNDPWEKAGVFEVWDVTTKKVYWHVLGMDVILDEKDDPLHLSRFFPCPPPLIANTTTSNVMPRADYQLAQDQYDQIDELTTRITWLTRAAKVVGVYDKQNTEMSRVFTEGLENQLIPVNNWAAFAEKGGMKGLMDFVPIDMIAKTINDLTIQRDTLKNNLYEVLGIGDIMRGMTDPDETLGAQQLKAQFGGSRLQFKQMDIGKWVAAGQRIHAEIICYHFQPETIIERSNIMHSPDAQMAQQSIEFLKTDMTKKYRITVESETMAMVDWAQERDSRTQFLQAVGGFMDSIGPFIDAQPQAAPVLLQMLKWGLGGFRVSKEIETVLDQAIGAASQPQQPPQPNPLDEAKVKETIASAQQKTSAAVKNIADAREKNTRTALAPAETMVAAMGAAGEPPVPELPPPDQANIPGMAPVEQSPLPPAPMQ